MHIPRAKLIKLLEEKKAAVGTREGLEAVDKLQHDIDQAEGELARWQRQLKRLREIKRSKQATLEYGKTHWHGHHFAKQREQFDRMLNLLNLIEDESIPLTQAKKVLGDAIDLAL